MTFGGSVGSRSELFRMAFDQSEAVRPWCDAISDPDLPGNEAMSHVAGKSLDVHFKACGLTGLISAR